MHLSTLTYKNAPLHIANDAFWGTQTKRLNPRLHTYYTLDRGRSPGAASLHARLDGWSAAEATAKRRDTFIAMQLRRNADSSVVLPPPPASRSTPPPLPPPKQTETLLYSKFILNMLCFRFQVARHKGCCCPRITATFLRENSYRQHTDGIT